MANQCLGRLLGEELVKGPKPSILVDYAWEISSFKESDEGMWICEGYGSIYTPDQIDDEVLREAVEMAVRNMPGISLLFNHNPDEPIGKVLEAEPDGHGMFVRSMISKSEPKRWIQVQDGTLSKYSIRLYEPEGVNVQEGETRKIRVMQVPELSLTSLPMHIGARMELAYVSKSRSSNAGLEVAAMAQDAGAVLKAIRDACSGLIENMKTKGEGEAEEPNAGSSPSEDPASPEGEAASPDSSKGAESEPQGKGAKTEEPAGTSDEGTPAAPSESDEVKAVSRDEFDEIKKMVVTLGQQVGKLTQAVADLIGENKSALEKTMTENKDEMKGLIDELRGQIEDQKSTIGELAGGSQKLEDEGDPPPKKKAQATDSKWTGAFPMVDKLKQRLQDADN